MKWSKKKIVCLSANKFGNYIGKNIGARKWSPGSGGNNLPDITFLKANHSKALLYQTFIYKKLE